MFLNFAASILQFLHHIAPALVIVLVGGFLGGFFLQWYFAKRSNESALIDSIMRTLDEIRNDSLQCCFPNSAGKNINQKLLDQRIKSNLRTVSSMIEIFTNRYFSKHKEELETFVSRIFELTTSGNFESAKREAKPDDYIRITNATNEIRKLLLHRKL